MTDSTLRVRYVEGQTLTGNDLSAEQTYRVVARRRHRLGLHGWGVVDGLRVSSRDDGTVEIEPGVAVDGYGREIVVHAPITLSAERVQREIRNASGGAIDVWLEHRRQPFQPRGIGRAECGPGRHRRTLETFQVRLTAAVADPARPPGIPADALARRPHAAPAGDPEPSWPVYLGRIGGEPVARRYADRYGHRMAHPTGRLDLGWDGVHTPAQRFAIRHHPEPTDEEPAPAPADLLAIEPSTRTVREPWPECRRGAPAGCWLTTWRGPVSVTGDVTLTQGPCGPQAVRFGPLPAPPAEAAPWTIYRSPAHVDEETKDEVPEQLRFEIGHPGEEGNPSSYGFVLATPLSDALRVGADCAVTVGGSLRVDGRLLIVEPPIDADPTDPQFAALSGQYWARGLAAALGVVTALSLSLAVTSSADGIITYTVKATNTGTTPLKNVQVVETITGDVFRQARLVATASQLNKGASRTWEDLTTDPDQPFSAGDTVTLHIEVVGLGPYFYFARDRQSQTVQIEEEEGDGEVFL